MVRDEEKRYGIRSQIAGRGLAAARYPSTQLDLIRATRKSSISSLTYTKSHRSTRGGSLARCSDSKQLICI
jgi:hypothetical protein